ncbi:DUF6318 family protein [uncultured Pseudokineococcus sp.]|uniref:DUF6318 family protein n=1 Tax=uncultured Pseudokineococcus sp. TaxID=1642928 RepID=UPI002637860B|nr:DUF6318 family protein [uncultured Pseudokineococcus sp.]
MRLLAPAAAAVLLLALTGCSEPEPGSPMPTGAPPATSAQPSDQPSPAASPTEPAATSEATETSAPAPTLPPEATTNDAAGAEAFVRYWYQTLNDAYRTGRTESLSAASAEECEACRGLADYVKSTYASGGHIEGGEVRLQEVVSPAPDNTGAVLLSVVFDQSRLQRLNAGGEVVDEEAAITSVSQSAVIQRAENDDGWRMFGLAR